MLNKIFYIVILLGFWSAMLITLTEANLWFLSTPASIATGWWICEGWKRI